MIINTVRARKKRRNENPPEALASQSVEKRKQQKRMTSSGHLRLQRDLNQLNLPERTATLSFPHGKDDITSFFITIRPDEGYYVGGSFVFSVDVPWDYPHKPPKVKCVTRPIYHPNIDSSGNVCLNILREDWEPFLNINIVVYGLIHLFMHPNHEDPLNVEAAAAMKDNPEAFEANVRKAMAEHRCLASVRFKRSI